ncbi:fumarate hydratase, class II [Enterococcus haemoperoxidus ATCC BAA-382]|uniref:Fumarate hydratase class II n=1 Tax=Enterococcus haemoperoxidus ATCC BAA-382 TaxID=1158608 RepID=R2TJC6_9ENTE|nr:class II fumarate hydratase [Enterococcus haemoperoxidus]EOI00242.1 fumarate hydratase, class II [Enterococcus haemoperoxidus ATCC BAA-382]EOT59668.1 fumarate hydratase, class II [Enterococcus haemoperoxidus ATCC BAA-382]OJG53077.1 fumarate hydratase, class II [Enterococcus haemoperoxidus]
MSYRIEHDSMGEIQVPETALWGAQTERSRKNFNIGIEKMPKALIQALALVKKNAAKANEATGKLETTTSQAIQQAADKIIKGTVDEHFPLSLWQTGSGTQTNMNVNEVIAHLAAQSGVTVHPNDHVNMSQSSNDVFPTAIHIAGVNLVQQQLFPVINQMIQTLKKLEAENEKIIKIGRTHLQDATPVTFSQEISGWRSGLEHSYRMLALTLDELKQLAIGGTAVGTGLNASKEYVALFFKYLNEETNNQFSEDPNKFHGLASKDAVVFTSGALKALAANVMKMANDIRWMASGPRSGLGEITIPANEPGSSIMPGKINPTQCEALTMIAIQVMGNDTTIGIGASQGNFELNVYMPVMAYNLIQSIELLTDGLRSFDQNCLVGIKADQEKMNQYVEQSLMLITALNGHIGYDNGAKIAKKAFEENITLKQAALTLGLVTEEEYDSWVKPEQMLGK